MTRFIALSAVFAFALAVVPCVVRADTSPAAKVVLHDRGNKIDLNGADADEIARLCIDLVKRGDAGGGGLNTDTWQAVRANEVAVEVRFDEPQVIELKYTNKRARPQLLLVPLTGEFTAPNGNKANVMAGRLARRSDFPYLGFEYVNGPDEYGFQYYTTYYTLDGLDDLRRAVAKLGVEAPREQFPEITPNRSPMAIPPAAARE
jgi:hypothetical protein